jgi:hypothetical protein
LATTPQVKWLGGRCDPWSNGGDPVWVPRIDKYHKPKRADRHYVTTVVLPIAAGLLLAVVLQAVAPCHCRVTYLEQNIVEGVN